MITSAAANAVCGPGSSNGTELKLILEVMEG
jgi:hypothetical protein